MRQRYRQFSARLHQTSGIRMTCTEWQISETISNDRKIEYDRCCVLIQKERQKLNLPAKMQQFYNMNL